MLRSEPDLDSQIIKFIHIRHHLVKIVHFIDNKNDWLVGAAEHICHF